MTVQKQLVLTDVVCVSTNQMASRVGDEVAILDLDHSVYYGLDPVGARIWELLQAPTPLTVVVTALVAEFEVDAATAGTDLLALVDELRAKRLVRIQASDAS